MKVERSRRRPAAGDLAARARWPRAARFAVPLLASLTAMTGMALTGLTATPAHAAADIHVEMTGVDDPSCGPAAAPCATVGYAYSVRAASGDTITVGPGDFAASNPHDTSGNPANAKYLYITKTVHFVGAQAGVDARTRTIGGPGETVIYNDLPGNASAQLWYVAAPGVTIDGFTFSDVLPGAGHYELVGSGSGGAGVQTKNDLGASGTDSDGWQVVNNVFKMTDIGLYAGSAGTTPSLVKHNLFDDNGGVINSNVNTAGIYSDHPLVNATITENTFTGTASANPVNISTGFATPSSNVTISDNTMDGQASVSFYNVSDSVITGNSMAGVQRGVALDGGDHGITIADNTISGPFSVSPASSRNCIQLSNTWNVGQNSDVTIFDNIMDHCVTGGISIANTDSVTADYNLITNSGRDGILVAPNTNVYGRLPGPPTGPRAGAPAATTPPVTTGVTMTRNTITGSTGFGISVAAGSYTGPMLARFNRIVDNGSYDGLDDNEPNATIDARWNWWGCNTPDSPAPPTHPGCGTVKGTAAVTVRGTAPKAVTAPSAATVTYAPWLILTIASSPADVQPGQAALISSTVHTDSAGGDTTGLATPPAPYFRVVPDTFTAASGQVSPAIVTLTPPLNASTKWPAGQPRPTRICSTVDHQTVCLTWAPPPAAPALSLVKSARPAVVRAAGTLVTYTYLVTNTGNVTLHNVSVDETAFTGTGTLSPIRGGATTLAPGASTTFTATYRATQADVNAGKFDNTAVAAGTPPSGPAVDSRPAMAEDTSPARPALHLAKKASPTVVRAAGALVTYTFTVTNTGNVTLHGIAIRDVAFSGTGRRPTISGGAAALAPRASTTFRATYRVTAADLKAGQITNTALASGRAPSGAVVRSRRSTAVVTAVRALVPCG